MLMTILEQGLIYGILALGLLITYRILDFPDLTVDSSFPLGAAVSAVLTVNGVHPALCVKPKTPAEAVLPFLPYCDLILVMTVEPGFGGQAFMQDMMPKLRTIRSYIDEQKPDCELEVDGGVNETTARICRENGANVLVAGSAYFKAADPAGFVRSVKE